MREVTNSYIKIALENGYSYYAFEGIEQSFKDNTFDDPLFWQALARGLKWKRWDDWVRMWSLCAEHRGKGKDVEEFFTGLSAKV